MGTNIKLDLHVASPLGFKPGPHWWEASAPTTVPSLLPTKRQYFFFLEWDASQLPSIVRLALWFSSAYLNTWVEKDNVKQCFLFYNKQHRCRDLA